MRKPLIAGNFKMFKTVAETVSYVNDLKALIKDTAGVDRTSLLMVAQSSSFS